MNVVAALAAGFTLGYALRARRARVANRRRSRLAARQHRERLAQLRSLAPPVQRGAR